MVVGMFVTASFREGLDADMVPMLSQMGSLDLLLGIAMTGGFGLLFLLAGWWITRLKRRGGRTFVAISAGIPASLQASMTGFYIIVAALEAPSNIAPFPANSIFYLPNWLALAVTIAAQSAGAATYLLIARAARD